MRVRDYREGSVTCSAPIRLRPHSVGVSALRTATPQAIKPTAGFFVQNSSRTNQFVEFSPRLLRNEGDKATIQVKNSASSCSLLRLARSTLRTPPPRIASPAAIPLITRSDHRHG